MTSSHQHNELHGTQNTNAAKTAQGTQSTNGTQATNGTQSTSGTQNPHDTQEDTHNTQNAKATSTTLTPLHILIIGAGLGGLACAIACRHENLRVTILEKATALSEIGAGIQLPPNATRVMDRFGLMPKLYSAGCTSKSYNQVLRWENGEELGRRPGEEWAESKFGYKWHVMHRADYQFVLADEVGRLGGEMRLGIDVEGVECKDSKPVVRLKGGESVEADVVVGADGLRSMVRGDVLGFVKHPEESGDMAYRITIPKEALKDEDDEFLKSIVNDRVNAIWFGQNMHVVLYGVRHDSIVNLVLVCPDDLPPGTDRKEVHPSEMAAKFEGWDPRLRKLLHKVSKALKWKIWGMEALDTWTRGSVALLGDACHPSVPYAASGAAMAVEDGAVLGRLLGLFAKKRLPAERLPGLLRLYEGVRKERTGTVVQTAEGNRVLYHMVDGAEQRRRDELLKDHDWSDEDKRFPWVFADLPYLHQMYGCDAVGGAEEQFKHWCQ